MGATPVPSGGKAVTNDVPTTDQGGQGRPGVAEQSGIDVRNRCRSRSRRSCRCRSPRATARAWSGRTPPRRPARPAPRSRWPPSAGSGSSTVGLRGPPPRAGPADGDPASGRRADGTSHGTRSEALHVSRYTSQVCEYAGPPEPSRVREPGRRPPPTIVGSACQSGWIAVPYRHRLGLRPSRFPSPGGRSRSSMSRNPGRPERGSQEKEPGLSDGPGAVRPNHY